jgi:cytochrome c oxidase subunit 4
MNHVTPAKVYYRVFAALLMLLVATVGVSFLKLGALNVLVALGIAFLKMLLIVLYFMHVKHSTRLTWVFVGAGFFWLGILLVLTMSDYLTRGGFLEH